MPTRAPARKSPIAKSPASASRAVKAPTAKSAPAKKAASAAPQAAVTKGARQDDKPAKIKLVRDSFTIPKPEYAAIDQLKKRAAKSGLPSKKSEVLRAGLMALAAMGDGAFQAAMSAVPTLKTGRPRKA
jgi:hypothetical protein